MTSPEALFLRFRQRADGAALAAVFDALAPELLLVAAHVAAPGSDPADLLQATFLDGIDKAARWDSARPLLPWLIGILVNHARQERRRLHRVVDPERVPRAAAEPSPLDALAANEVAEQVAAALASLPRQLRQTLSLRLVHGLTPTEIAHALGCPVATAKTRLQRGMEWLRRVLPAGIAVSVAGVVTTGRGLAAVRAVVLGKAKVAAVATGMTAAGVTAGVIAGGLAMKKVVIAAIALLCVAALWVVAPRPDEPARVPARVPAAPMPVVADASSATAMQPPADAPVAIDRVAVPTGAPVTTGSAALEFAWKGDGTPAAGLRVSRQRDSRDGPSQTLPDLHADAHGRLQLADQEPGDYFLIGTRLWHRLTIVAGTEVRERIEVEPVLRIDGVVVDSEGRGVEGAEVCMQYFPDPANLLPRTIAVTRADGTFHCTLDTTSWFWARKVGFAPSEPNMHVEEGSVQLRFVLANKGTPLRGRVLTAAGTPAADSRLTIVRTAPRDHCGAPIVLRCDAHGRFATDEVVPGEYLLVAQTLDHAATPVPFTVDEGSTPELVVRLAAGATVLGVVLAGGKPARAALEARPAWAGGSPEWIEALRPIHHLCTVHATTDADGNYRLEHVPAGKVKLETRAQGAAVDESRRLQLQDGETQRCDFLLGSGGEIRGRVVDANGRTLENWDVSVDGQHGGSAGGLDAQGVFTFQGLDEAEYTVTARPMGYTGGVDWVKVEHVRPGPAELLLHAPYTIDDAAWITGVLLAMDGTPPLAAKGLVLRDGEVQVHACEVRLRDGGAFKLGPLPPGSYGIDLWIPDQGRLQVGKRDLQPRQKLDVGTLRLPSPGTLELHFATRDGRTVAPTELSAWSQAGNGGEVFARGADGIYRSKPVPAGTYRVFAWGADFALFRQEVQVVGERNTMVELLVDAAVPVRFEMPRPAGVDGARWTGGVVLAILDAGGKSVRSQYLAIDVTDRFVWERGLAPGSYTYEATLRPDGRPVHGAFTVTGDTGPQRVEIALQAKAK